MGHITMSLWGNDIVGCVWHFLQTNYGQYHKPLLRALLGPNKQFLVYIRMTLHFIIYYLNLFFIIPPMPNTSRPTYLGSDLVFCKLICINSFLLIRFSICCCIYIHTVLFFSIQFLYRLRVCSTRCICMVFLLTISGMCF